MIFNNTEKHDNSDFGYIKLTPYYDNDSRTVFNITMHNIKWTNIKFRFRNSSHIYTMREFVIDKNVNVSSDKVLFYDCPWNIAEIEGSFVQFEYEYEIDNDMIGRLYNFYVPKHEYLKTNDISELETFAYVDYSNFYKFNIRIQIPPKIFNITQYEIEIYRTRNENSVLQDIFIVDISDEKYGEIEYPYYPYGSYGSYDIKIRPLHDSCTQINNCIKTTTISISIPKGTNYLVIGMVGASAIIPFIFISLYIWKSQCTHDIVKKRLSNENNLLLISIPSNDIQIKIVELLSDFLQSTFGWNVLYDTKDIPNYPKQDPLNWLMNSFDKATHIVFLLSIENASSEHIIYKNLDDRARELTKLYWKKCCVMEFHYSTADYEEFRNLKRFDFARDFDGFIDYVGNRRIWERMLDKLSYHDNDMFKNLKNEVNKVLNDNLCLKNIRRENNIEFQFVPESDDEVL